MTLAANPTKLAYPGPGGTSFVFPYAVQSDTYLVLHKTVQATGVITGNALLLGTDYTVAGVGGTSVTITLTTDLGAFGLLIQHIVPITQDVSLANEGAFKPKTHEAEFDKLTQIALQQQEQIDRSIKFPANLSTDGELLDQPGEGYVLGWVGGVLRNLSAATAQLAADLLSSAVGKGSALITYLAPYTGAVARTQADKNAENLTAADFGSDINAAITAIGSANVTLVVDSPITVNNNAATHANTSIVAQKPGLLTVASGKTLTINGPFKAGDYQVFAGAGSVVFSINSRTINSPFWYGNQPGSPFTVGRSLVTDGGVSNESPHAFEDNSTINFTYAKAANYNAYASYDANINATGAGSYDHVVGFQARQTFSGSNEVWSRMDSFNSRPTVSGTGTVAMLRGLHVENPGGTGPITECYGVYVESLTRGTTRNVAYLAQGGVGAAAQMQLRGNGQVGAYGLIVGSNADGTASIEQTSNADLFFSVNNVEFARMTPAGVMTLRKPAGVAAVLRVQGNGISGGFGVSLISGADGTATLGQASNKDLTFETNNAERIRILAAGIPTYADNAAATTGSVPVNGLYRTATGQLMIRY